MTETQLDCYDIEEILHLGYHGQIPAMTTDMWQILETKLSDYGDAKYSEGWDDYLENLNQLEYFHNDYP